jgi:hypothetical protein
MKNTFIIVGVVGVVAAAGIIFTFRGPGKNTPDPLFPKTSPKNAPVEATKEPADSAPDTTALGICGTFPKESIASITGLDIVSASVYSVEGSENSNCRYYIRGKSYAPVLSIGKYAGDTAKERQKYADTKYFKGWQVGTDPRITMEHFITFNEVRQLNDIYMIAGTSTYYRITLYSLSMLRGSQMVDLAVQISPKMK